MFVEQILPQDSLLTVHGFLTLFSSIFLLLPVIVRERGKFVFLAQVPTPCVSSKRSNLITSAHAWLRFCGRMSSLTQLFDA